ncbi:transposase family protein [Pseudomonas aeruginosa]|nr:transposase family protein [Pseudomonas aeruginosa]
MHIDFAGPFEGSYWLVLCDALSKWVEIRPMKHINTRSLCLTLDNIFCTFGLPKMIISDNGPQFTSYEFKEYCTKQSILHVTSSPYHPRTNGLAERLVRTFKNRMASVDNTNLERRLLEFLFTYRNTSGNLED